MQDIVINTAITPKNNKPTMEATQWQALVALWKKSSGVKLSDFCKEHMVNPTSFYYWLSKDKTQFTPKTLSFAKIQMGDTEASTARKTRVEIKAVLPGGAKLQVTTNCSVETIINLITGLQ